jgi:hypothetical protein
MDRGGSHPPRRRCRIDDPMANPKHFPIDLIGAACLNILGLHEMLDASVEDDGVEASVPRLVDLLVIHQAHIQSARAAVIDLQPRNVDADRIGAALASRLQQPPVAAPDLKNA